MKELPETLICSTCGEESKIAPNAMWMSTLVGYFSPPGHDHDDNCIGTTFVCKNNHKESVSVLNKCSDPEYDWVGKETCFCHPGKKIDMDNIGEKDG